jgi:chondroitin AC lyase
MNRELLLRNPENVAAIFDLLWSHIAITTGDGIQADGSFHFHGNQLYSGGYGADEAVQLATICQLTSGLAGFAPPPAAFDIVSLYLLNGTQYILRTGPNGTFFDLSTKGREITRAPDGNLAFPSAVFIQALNSTIFLDSAHGAEYKALLDQVAGIGRPVVGARHFYRSDCMFFFTCTLPTSILLPPFFPSRILTFFCTTIATAIDTTTALSPWRVQSVQVESVP